jgi:P4 family phage/plasmid primase-like protien
MISPLKWARQYLSRDWSPIPVPHGEKVPRRRSWPDLRVTAETAPQYFNGQPQNIGILLGEPSHWLIDVDLDHPLALKLADKYLPAKPAVFGRKSKPRSHWLYKVTAPIKSKKFTTGSKKTIVEIRSTGGQTVFPPSVHPSGERVAWEDRTAEPAEITPDELRQAASRLAQAVRHELGEKEKQPAKESNPATAPADRQQLIERARAYLEKLPPAVSGEGGHDRTFNAATILRCGFGLSYDEAWPLLQEWNKTCEPPWTEAELDHKLKDAGEKPVTLHLLSADRNGAGREKTGKKIPARKLDPMPEARKFLSQCYTAQGLCTLKFHRGTFHVWDGRRYLEVSEEAMLSILRLYLERFTCQLANSVVSNILASVRALTFLSEQVEIGRWLDDPERAGNWLALQNGILDIGAFLAGREDVLRPHTPQWFSPVCLPYEFNRQAPCPKWRDALEHNMEGDRERIQLLQEWAGYNLVYDTSEQKFMTLAGDGGNGKSVYCAGLTGILGDENVSHLALEAFGERFKLFDTYGKLANIAMEVGELDRVAEGTLKQFTAGDRIGFERKYKDTVNAAPTARVTLSCNTLPRYSDRTSGIWRRLLLVPFRVKIEDAQNVKGMCEPEWWREQGELPGMLLWALRGLRRLRRQNGFTRSETCQTALEEYRQDSNPAAMFLAEHVVEAPAGQIVTSRAYQVYVAWCDENGFKNLASNKFGAEIKRAFPKAKPAQISWAGSRVRGYTGVALRDEIECETDD